LLGFFLSCNHIDVSAITEKRGLSEGPSCLLIFFPLKVSVFLLQFKLFFLIFKSLRVDCDERFGLVRRSSAVELAVEIKQRYRFPSLKLRIVLVNLTEHLADAASSHLKKSQAFLVHVDVVLTVGESCSLLNFLLVVSIFQIEQGTLFGKVPFLEVLLL